MKATPPNYAYASLVREIRRKCQQDRWYGGSLDDPKWLGNEQDPRRSGFAFPPATETQLQATEAILGRELPPLLRTLLKELANGGFGPGAGLRGVRGGYGTPVDYLDPTDGNETLEGSYLFKKQTTHFIEHAEEVGTWEIRKGWKPNEQQTQVLVFPEKFWPRSFLPICDMGDLREACMDSHTEELFIIGRVSEESLSLVREAPTLEQWLNSWVFPD